MIKENYESIERRVCEACARAGRKRESVTVIGVSKLHPAEAIREAYKTTPLRAFGENYVQEFCAKRDALVDLDVEWHFIGHLQRNKVRALLAKRPTLIHTVDSIELTDTLERIMSEDRPEEVQDVLIEVRHGDEDTAKTGCFPNQLEELSEHIARQRHLKLRGLMLIPPIEADPAQTRHWFKDIFRFAAWMNDRNDMSVLSYGMSSDFEIAIEEGATHVRIGTAIFGERHVNES